MTELRGVFAAAVTPLAGGGSRLDEPANLRGVPISGVVRDLLEAVPA